MHFQTSREYLDKIIAKYEGYVSLYRAINNGSAEGVTPFHVFYRRMTYDAKYADVGSMSQSKF